MRELIIRVPRGQGLRVMSIAQRHGGEDLFAGPGSSLDGDHDLVRVNIGNAKVERLLPELQEVPDLHITFGPRGVLALRPPENDAADQVVDVQPRSPFEIVLSGLQSIGSWPGFLGYAAAGGVIVWIGLFTETVFLLVAAMLVAPFAGPAMTAALGTARGDLHLFRRSILRYFAALALSIAVAFLLSLIFQQKIATGLMVQQSLVPSVAILLPLVAGAAGALNLCQSDRSSLVSGAATGMLVAASLAPPAGLVGMGAAIGEWDMVHSAAFLLLLQIAGINVAGTIVFRLFGVSPDGPRFGLGSRGTGWTVWVASLAALAALLVYQLSDSPRLERSTTAQRATQDVRTLIDQSGLASALEVDARFTRADIPGQDSLLVTAYVQSDGADGDLIKSRLSDAIRQRLNQNYNVKPLVDITVLGQ